AIGIGGKDQGVGLLRLFGDRLELLRAVGRDLPLHVEALIGIHRPVLRRKVADMAEGREHAVPASQIFLDGFRLRRRFDDDEFQGDGVPIRTYARWWRRALMVVKRREG